MNRERLQEAYKYKEEQLFPKVVFKEFRWQHEFYHTLSSCLGRKALILSDSGAEVDCANEIDFYVNGEFKWGIEISREGDKYKQHRNIFGPGGFYSNLVDGGEHIIIDFRAGKFIPLEGKEKDKLMRVIYEQDFSEASIFYEENFLENIKFSQ